MAHLLDDLTLKFGIMSGEPTGSSLGMFIDVFIQKIGEQTTDGDEQRKPGIDHKSKSEVYNDHDPVFGGLKIIPEASGYPIDFPRHRILNPSHIGGYKAFETHLIQSPEQTEPDLADKTFLKIDPVYMTSVKRHALETEKNNHHQKDADHGERDAEIFQAGDHITELPHFLCIDHAFFPDHLQEGDEHGESESVEDTDKYAEEESDKNLLLQIPVEIGKAGKVAFYKGLDFIFHSLRYWLLVFRFSLLVSCFSFFVACPRLRQGQAFLVFSSKGGQAFLVFCSFILGEKT